MSKFYVFSIKSHASSRFSVNFPSFGTDNFCVKIIIFYRLSQCGSALPGWKQKLINVASPEIAYLYANPICLLTPNICTGVLLHTNRQWLGMILMGNNDHKLSRKHSTSNLIPRHGHGHFRFCGRVASQICHLWSSDWWNHEQIFFVFFLFFEDTLKGWEVRLQKFFQNLAVYINFYFILFCSLSKKGYFFHRKPKPVFIFFKSKAPPEISNGWPLMGNDEW